MAQERLSYPRTISPEPLKRGNYSSIGTTTLMQKLRPGQTATLQADKIVVSKASSSASDWLEGDFDMDQVTLAEAMSDIGAWYNKTVVFQSQANMDKLIHFRFSRRASLQEIITALNEMGVAKVRIEKGKIMVL